MTIQWKNKAGGISESRAEELANAFRGLGHPARLQLFQALLDRGPLPAGELTTLVPLAPSTVSQHLSRLKGCGLVQSSPRGLLRIYSVDRQAWERFRRALLPFLTSISAKYETLPQTRSSRARSWNEEPA